MQQKYLNTLTNSKRTTASNVIGFFLFFYFSINFICAQTTRTSTGSSDWNTASTWSPSGVPAASDIIIIRSGDIVAVSTTPSNAVASVTFNNASASTSGLTIASGATLTVTGLVTLQNSSTVATNASISGAGSLLCGSLSIGFPTTTRSTGALVNKSDLNTLTLSNSNITVTNNIALNNDDQGGGFSSVPNMIINAPCNLSASFLIFSHTGDGFGGATKNNFTLGSGASLSLSSPNPIQATGWVKSNGQIQPIDPNDITINLNTGSSVYFCGSSGNPCIWNTTSTPVCASTPNYSNSPAYNTSSITLTSGAGTNLVTTPVTVPVVNITYSTIGATGATFSGLPPGVTGSWSGGVITISGTPTAVGVYNYSVTTVAAGTCGIKTATGTITTYVCPTFSLLSTSTSTVNVCIGSSSLVTLTANLANLPVGTYTVSYEIQGVAQIDATMTVTTAGTGSFVYSGFTSAGNRTLTITKITSGLCSSVINTNNIDTITVYATLVAPTALAGSGATCNQITANWNALSGTTYYELDVSTSNTFATFVTGYNALNVGLVTSYNITGLTAGTTYYYRARAYNGNCISSSSAPITYATVNTPTVTANTGTLSSCSGFTTNWTLNPTATTYFLDVSTVNSFASFVTGYNNLNVGNVNSWNVTGLSANTTYYYRIRANNSCGTGANSSTITFATINTPIVTANVGTLSSCSGFTTNWTLNPTATTYFIDVSTVNTFASFVTGYNNLNVGNVNSRSVTGLSASTTYYYRIRANNSCGTGANSSTITFATINTPTVTANVGTLSSCSGFTANWTLNPTATTYFIDVSTVNTFASFVTGYNNLNVGNVNSRIVTGLSASTTYYYRIRANNSCGTGANSSTITFATINTPTVVSSVGTIGCSGFTANWTLNPTATTYFLDVSTVNTFASFVTGYNNLNVGNVSSWNVTGLTATTYYYRIRAFNSCGTGVNSSTQTLTLSASNITPSTPVITGTLTFCENDSVTLGATSGGSSYNWYLNGSLISMETTGFLFVTTAGIYTVRLTNASGCQSAASAASVIVVQGLPTATAGGSQTICSNGTATVSGATASNGTILWIENGAGSITSGATTLTPVYTPAIGDSGNTVTLTMIVTSNNTCSPQTATATYTVIVNAVPTAGLTSSDNDNIFCAGTSVTFTATGGTNFNFRVDGNSVQNSDAATYTSTTLTDGQEVDVILTNASTCIAISTVITNTVTALPAATFSYAGSPYCSSSANPSPIFSGGGVAGVFSSTAGLNFVSTATGQINLATSTAGTYTVTNTISASGGCAIVTATAIVTVNPVPVGVTLSGNQYVCSYNSNTTSLSSTVLGGIWSTSNAAIATVNTSTGVVTGIGFGTAIITYTMTSSGCTITAERAVYVASGPGTGPLSVNGSTTQCRGATAIYTITPNPYSYDYNWTYDGSDVTVTVAPDKLSATFTFGAAAIGGNIVVSSTNGCGTGVSTSSYLYIAVPYWDAGGTIAGGTVSGGTTICLGSTSALLTLSGNSGTITKWQSSVSPFITWTDFANTATTYTSGSLTSTTQFRAVVQSGSCIANSEKTTVTVSPAKPATPGTITGTATQCPALTAQTYSITAVTNASTFNWTVPTGWSITSGAGTTSITVTTGSAGQNGNVSVTAQNSCGTSTAQALAVTVSPAKPATPGTITGAATQCSALTAQTYSITAVTNASTYNWTVPTGWSITSGAGTTSITVTTGSAGQNGNVSVTAQNSCGASTAQALAVTVSPATPGTITGSATVCAGTNSTTLNLSGHIGAITRWESSLNNFATAGTTIANTTTTLTATNLTSTTYYRAVITSGSCTSNSATATVTVSPASVGGTIAGSATVCTGTNSTTLTLSGHTGTITRWESSLDNFATAGTSIANPMTILTATNLTATTYYRAVIISGSCAAANSAKASVTIRPTNTVSPASYTPNVCINNFMVPIIHETNGATGIGTPIGLPTGVTANWFTLFGFSSILISGTPSQSGTFNYSIPLTGGCGSVNATGTITVSPATPATPGTITGTATQCPALTAQTYSIAAVTNASTYNWTVPTGWSITSGAGTTSITVTTGSSGQNGNVSVTAQNSCGTSTAQALAVTVSPAKPATPGTITGTATQCPALTAQTYSIAAVTNASTYNWTVPIGWSITAGAGTTSITVTIGSSGQNGNVSVTAQNSCGTSAAQTFAVTVNPAKPATPGTITGAATQCPALTAQIYSIAAVTNASTYNWTVPTGWSITSGAGTTSITVTTGSASQNGNVSVTAQNSCGTSAAQTFAVTVNPAKPATPGTITGAATQCPALTAQTYSIAAVTNASTYNWTVPTGWSITAGAGTTSITVTTGSSSQNGNVSVTAQNSCGTSTSNTLLVTVNPTVSINAFSPTTSTRCQGAGTVTTTTIASNNSAAIVYSLDATTLAFSGNSINASTGAVTYAAGWSGTTTITASAAGCNGPVTTTHLVSVNPTPIITMQPKDYLKCEGSIVTIDVVASGTGLSYVWQRKLPTDVSFFTIPVETNVSYPFPNEIRLENIGSSQSPSGTQYQTVITASTGCSVTSSVATLLVNEIIGITSPILTPVQSITDVKLCYGTNYSYTVSTSTPPPGLVVSYQWKSSVASGVWIDVVDGTHFSGANTATLNIINGTPAESAEYRVYITFTSSSGTCNVSSTTLNRKITFLPLLTTPITTVTQPTCTTATGTITVTVQSASDSYSFDNGFSYQASNVKSGLTTGNYNVIIKNSLGCVSVTTATVINPQPLTPVQPILSALTQPSCTVATGSFTIINYNASYSYTVSPSTVTISGSTITAPEGSYTVAATLGSCSSIASASVTILSLVTKTWNGIEWLSNGVPTTVVPTSDNLVVIDGNYTITSIPSVPQVLNSCSLVIKSGKLQVQAGTSLIIQNDLTVNADATLDILDKGSLVMVNDAGIVTNTGTTYVRRVTTPFKKYDYVYWSSPVATTSIASTFQNKGWNTNRAYGYIPGSDWSYASTMSPGNGYIIMVPTPTNVNISEVVFSGKVNNGDKIKITGVIPNSSYLLGNPYPSAIDADAFLDANQNVLGGTLYFWTHNTAIQLASGITNGTAGSGTYAFTSDDYATYNTTGGVATAEASNSLGINTSIPTGNIASGQGFFGSSLPTIGTIKEIVYNNSMRLTGALDSGKGVNEQFFKTSNTKSKTAGAFKKHRIWLDLKNSQGAFKQTLVGYITGATNDYDSRFDGESFDGNQFVDFYSVNQNKNLTIQGRALPFDEKDTVALGFKTTIDGSFTMKIGQVDGLLIDQAIYLEDKLTNTLFDLKTGNYTFTTAKGTFNDRFVLRYTNDKTLGVNEIDTENGVSVFYSNNYKTLIIKNNVDSIVNSVSLFNITGQNIDNWDVKDGWQSNIQIPIKNISSGVYIVKVKTTKGEISNKIVIN